MDVKEIEKFGVNYELVEQYLNRYRNNNRNIVVTGEFSSGKSTFINAFLNRFNLLPNDNVECTPILIDIVKGNEERLVVHYKDGSNKLYPLTQDIINKYAIYSDEYDTNIMSLSLELSDVQLNERIHLIDTPGTNTILKEHEELTNYMLKQADIVIYVMNKVVNQSDIEKIKNILNYTKQIIFILTHMDDLEDGVYVNRPKEKMNPLLESAKRELTEAIGFEVDILPIGSKAAYSDSSLIDEIRNVLDEYLDFYQEKQLKMSINNQLTLLFELEFKKLKEEVENLHLIHHQEINHLDSHLEQINKKRKYIESNNQIRIESFEFNSSNILKRLDNQVIELFSQEESKILLKIKELSEVTPEVLKQWFQQSSLSIGTELRNILTEGINELLSNTYDESIKLVQDLYDNLGFKFNSNIAKPDLTQMKLKTPTYLLEHVNNKIVSLEEELEETTSEIKNLSEIISKKNEDLLSHSNDYKEALEQRRKIGSYIPTFDEHIEVGGSSIGATAGRLIGEVADVLMLMYNPAGGAAKVVDTVKDGAKILSYIQSGVQKVKHVREEVKKSPTVQLTNALDFLSLGFYCEKLGEYIGESIKPTQTLIVENQEHRQKWESEMSATQQNIQLIDLAKKKLENDIENDRLIFSEIRKRKKELEQQRLLLDSKKKEIELQIQSDYQKTTKEYIENYYKSQINHIFKSERTEAINKIHNIYHASLKDIMEKSESSLFNELDKLNSIIEATELEKSELLYCINEKQNLLDELKNYPQWIQEWMS